MVRCGRCHLGTGGWEWSSPCQQDSVGGMPIEVPSGDDLKTGRSIQQFAAWRWVAIAKSLECERTDQNSSAARLASVSQSGKCGSGIEKAIGGRALRHRIAPDIRDPQAVGLAALSMPPHLSPVDLGARTPRNLMLPCLRSTLAI